MDRDRDHTQRVRYDVHLHGLDTMPGWAGQLVASLISLELKVDKLMATIDELAASVQSETTVVDSVVALLTDIKAKLDAALSGTTIPPAVQAKIDEIFAGNEASKQKLADAIVANTPSA